MLARQPDHQIIMIHPSLLDLRFGFVPGEGEEVVEEEDEGYYAGYADGGDGGVEAFGVGDCIKGSTRTCN